MSLKIANRITTLVGPPKSQNVTTEACGRTNVLVREMNFAAATDLRNSMMNRLTSDQRIRNSLVLRNRKFVFKELQPLNQRRQPFLLAFIVEAAQAVVCFALPPFAKRKLVRRETPVPRRCFR